MKRTWKGGSQISMTSIKTKHMLRNDVKYYITAEEIAPSIDVGKNYQLLRLHKHFIAMKLCHKQFLNGSGILFATNQKRFVVLSSV